MAVQPLLTPKPGPTGYFHRELLIRTAQGRRVDLITVTDCHGILVRHEVIHLSTYGGVVEIEHSVCFFLQKVPRERIPENDYKMRRLNLAVSLRYTGVVTRSSGYVRLGAVLHFILLPWNFTPRRCPICGKHDADETGPDECSSDVVNKNIGLLDSDIAISCR